MSEQSAYFQSLRFNPSLNQSWIAGYFRNIRIALLLIIILVVVGLVGLFNLPRRINPEVNIPIVFISTVLPGASPEDIESLVTDPIEQAVRGVKGVKEISSTSRENISTIVIEFQSEIQTKEAQTDIQSAVNTVINLPSDAQKPLVQSLDFEDVPVVTIALASNTDDQSLFEFARRIKQALEDQPTVRKVVVSGLEKQIIEVTINPEALLTHKLNPIAIQQALSASLGSYPAGVIRSSQQQFSLAIEMGNNPIDKIRETRVSSAGSLPVRLGDIAEVSLRSQHSQPASYFAQSGQSLKRSVSFSVFKNTDAELEASARAAKETVTALVQPENGRFQLVTTNDYDQDINDQFTQLIKDFLTSVLLVFITLLVFLGIRQASIASLVIPLSFLFTFAVMYALGIDLSFISIFSLLLGMGMIVDDTIVMISAMTDYSSQGKFNPYQTALLVWNDYLSPTLASNLTNVWSFLPLLLATGIIGEFIDVVAIIVTIALVGSTAIALLITIPFMMIIIKPKVPKRAIWFSSITLLLVSLIGLGAVYKDSLLLLPIIITWIVLWSMVALIRSELGSRINHLGKQFKQVINNWLARAPLTLIHSKAHNSYSLKYLLSKYERVLLRVLSSSKRRAQVLWMVGIFSIFSYLLIPLGQVKNEFFPKTDEDMIWIEVELPASTLLEQSDSKARALLEQIKETPFVEYAQLDVGMPVNLTSTNTNQTKNNVFSLTLKLTPAEKRVPTSIEIAQQLREQYRNYPEGKFTVVEQSGGPPTGSDLQITILADDLGKLEEQAESIVNYLQSQPGTTNVEQSSKPGIGKVVLVPDLSKIHEAGLSISQIGFWSRLYTSGLTLDEVAIADQKYDVILRTKSTQQELIALADYRIPTQYGMRALRQFGQFSLKANPDSITRLDTKRSVTITAAVQPGFNQVELGTKLEQFARSNGYEYKVGGVNEENTRSINSILQAMLLSAFLILATLVIQLNSFRKAALVMLVIPLAISGVFIIFGLTGTPLSFPALIGILALFGIVVKNSIMIVDKINLNLAAGIPFKEAVAEGSASRLEPIFFSSITNIIGLIPISISDPLWRGLGGAIIAGLTCSGTIMLFFIPVVYYYWFKPTTRQNE